MKVGTRVRTLVDSYFEVMGGKERIPAGTLGTVDNMGRQSPFFTVDLDGRGSGYWYEATELEVVKTPPSDVPVDAAPDAPTLEQQLADALKRAERAERERDALKAFVQEVANSAPHSKPVRTYYASTTKFNADTSRWRFAFGAREFLKALEEKAVGDE